MIDCLTWVAGKSLIPGAYGDARCEVSAGECLLGHLCVLQSSLMVSVAFILALVEYATSQNKFPVGYGWM